MVPHGAFVSVLPATFSLGNSRRGQAGRTARKGEEGQKEVVCHSPTLHDTWHWQQLLDATTKMMNLLLSKRILREGGGGSEGKTHTVSFPQGESTLKGKTTRKPPPAPPLPACPSVWQWSPCTCSPVYPFRVVGGGMRGVWVGEWKGKEGRAKRGCTEGSASRRLCAGAVAATAGRGRQHGGVSGGVGASQQQWRP